MGKHFGRRLLHGTTGRIVKHEHLDKAEKYLADKGGKAVFLGRFTAALRVIAARFDEELVAEGRARDAFVIDLVCDAGEPWVVLAAITITDGQVDRAGLRDPGGRGGAAADEA